MSHHDRGGTVECIQLEDTTANTSATSNTEVTSPPRLRWVLLGLAGLVAVLLGLSRWQPNAPASTGTDEENAAAEDDGPAEETLGMDAPDGAVGAKPQIVADGSGPLLGEETGQALAIVRPSSGKLMVLDLDTGTEYELASRGMLVGVLDGHLVIQGERNVSALPLDSPDETAIEFSTGLVYATGVADDAVWVIREEDTTSLQAYDLSGRLLMEREVGPSIYAQRPPMGEVFQEEGGGIYRQTEGGFDRLSTGSLVLTGDDLALVRECDANRNCRRHWYRMSDWEGPLDLPVPPIDDNFWDIGLHANDRLLTITDWSSDRSRVIEVATGRTVQEGHITTTNTVTIQSSPFSADGRWLVRDAEQGILIIDLKNGNEFVYESDFTRSAELQGTFIDRDSVGFLS